MGKQSSLCHVKARVDTANRRGMGLEREQMIILTTFYGVCRKYAIGAAAYRRISVDRRLQAGPDDLDQSKLGFIDDDFISRDTTRQRKSDSFPEFRNFKAD